MKKFATAFGAVVLLAAFGGRVEAVPILGAQLTYTGGDVTVESLPVDSAFTSELGLYDATFSRLLFVMNDEPAGVTATFNPFLDFGIAPGSELIFGIRVVNNSSEFFMGPAGRNPDNVVHAAVDNMGAGVFHVGFEDFFGGGDLDYNDNRFAFSEGVRQTPEPAALGLVALGLVSIGYLRRRRTR
jgi:hypothetical protein